MSATDYEDNEEDDPYYILYNAVSHLFQGLNPGDDYFHDSLRAVRRGFENPIYWHECDRETLDELRYNLEDFIRVALQDKNTLVALDAYQLLDDYRKNLRSDYRILPVPKTRLIAVMTRGKHGGPFECAVARIPLRNNDIAQPENEPGRSMKEIAAAIREKFSDAAWRRSVDKDAVYELRTELENLLLSAALENLFDEHLWSAYRTLSKNRSFLKSPFYLEPPRGGDKNGRPTVVYRLGL